MGTMALAPQQAQGTSNTFEYSTRASLPGSSPETHPAGIQGAVERVQGFFTALHSLLFWFLQEKRGSASPSKAIATFPRQSDVTAMEPRVARTTGLSRLQRAIRLPTLPTCIRYACAYLGPSRSDPHLMGVRSSNHMLREDFGRFLGLSSTLAASQRLLLSSPQTSV